MRPRSFKVNGSTAASHTSYLSSASLCLAGPGSLQLFFDQRILQSRSMGLIQMTVLNKRAYYEARLRKNANLAERSCSPEIRKIHLHFVQLYQGLMDASDQPRNAA